MEGDLHAKSAQNASNTLSASNALNSRNVGPRDNSNHTRPKSSTMPKLPRARTRTRLRLPYNGTGRQHYRHLSGHENRLNRVAAASIGFDTWAAGRSAINTSSAESPKFDCQAGQGNKSAKLSREVVALQQDLAKIVTSCENSESEVSLEESIPHYTNYKKINSAEKSDQSSQSSPILLQPRQIGVLGFCEYQKEQRLIDLKIETDIMELEQELESKLPPNAISSVIFFFFKSR